MSQTSIPGVDDASQDTDGAGAAITLVPVKIMHQDGTAETVYIDKGSFGKGSRDEQEKNKKLHRQLSMVYITIGTVALSLTAIATIINLRKNHG